ncbi:MAG: TIGR03086 family protein [Acidimicrobiales bacterium]|nr:TIGR03086 family protein [Acidimicrobiales bacterium]
MSTLDLTRDPEDLLAKYRRSFETFERVLASVDDTRWGAPSACDQWTIADVAGHVTWGLQLVRALASGETFANRDGAPGAPNPRVVVGSDPVSAWRSARDACFETLDPGDLERVVQLGGPFGEGPLAVFVSALTTLDTPAHAWDIASAAGHPVELDADLLSAGAQLVHAMNFTRDVPGGLKSPLTPPPGADAQTCYLALLGRRAW